MGDFSLNNFSEKRIEARQAWDSFPTLCLLDNRADVSGLRVAGPKCPNYTKSRSTAFIAVLFGFNQLVVSLCPVYNEFTKRKELIKYLVVNGAFLIREGSSHSIYQRGEYRTAVPRHNEIVDELARKICRDLEIPFRK